LPALFGMQWHVALKGPMAVLRKRKPTIPAFCPQCGDGLDLLVNGQCPSCREEVPLISPKRRLPRFLSLPEMRYQNRYVWLVFVSAMDVILTMLVLFVWKGSEVNPVAESIIYGRGIGWAIAFKFAMMLTVVLVCEVAGRISDMTGRKLATAAVVINALPVAYTLVLLLFSGPPPQA